MYMCVCIYIYIYIYTYIHVCWGLSTLGCLCKAPPNIEQATTETNRCLGKGHVGACSDHSTNSKSLCQTVGAPRGSNIGGVKIYAGTAQAATTLLGD